MLPPQTNAAAGREALLSGGPQPSSSMETRAGERGLNALQDTQRVAADTEQLGMTILDQLGTQRNQLSSAMERRQEAHEGLSVSSRLIRQMHNRATWMKLSLCAIISFLVLGIFLIVYLQWFSGGKPASPPAPTMTLAAAPSPVAAVAAAAGRALQVATAAPPPSELSPPPPSPPPLTAAQRAAAAAAQASDGIGAGIIILVVVTGFSLIICFIAIPRSMTVRTAAFLFGFLLVLATTLFLFLMPIAPPPASAPPPSDELTDISTVARIFMISIATLISLCGCLCLLLCHFMVPQRAPVVVEAEPLELYREAKPGTL